MEQGLHAGVTYVLKTVAGILYGKRNEREVCPSVSNSFGEQIARSNCH
jgi:hypothetical protein